jgi:HPt (histidine-containing phosphotransfer) domain-containing protein
MRRVLDNVVQGLLTVDLAGKLASERSAVVDKWFGRLEPGAAFFECMASIDKRFSEMFWMTFDILVSGALPEDVAIGQMPTQLRQRDRQYQCSYEAIHSGDKLSGVLIVIDDITDSVKRARDEAEQRELLAMYRQLTRDRGGLLSFFEEGQALIDKLRAPGTALESMKAPLHTLKGTAAVMGFEVLAAHCHQIEDAIAEGENSLGLAALSDRWHLLASALRKLVGDNGRERLELSRQEVKGLVTQLQSGGTVEAAIATLDRWQLPWCASGITRAVWPSASAKRSYK